ncbi:Putative BTB/POZ domain-containing protein [Septoria linicola]|uniref:BTB/POZ domain-containing protein n=1 Tax=Septoria linicola TaxID=215465 RepID=A0A9Q9AZ38_9PEZI|nr:Putative BTB/POZ domain-containing protein [Septoria linicola]
MSVLKHHPIFNGLVPAMDLEELCNPTMVRIIVQDNDRSHTFQVPKELICSRSDYFSTLFKAGSNFTEASTGVATLRDTEIWAFKTYVGWLYSNQIVLAPNDQAQVMQNGQADDPSSWPYETLFQLYVIGDKYKTRAFRTLVIQHVQAKMRAAKELCDRMSKDQYESRVRKVIRDELEPLFFDLDDLDFLVHNVSEDSTLARCIWYTLANSDKTYHEYGKAWVKNLTGQFDTKAIRLGFEILTGIGAARARQRAVQACRNCGELVCHSSYKRDCAAHDRLEGWDERFSDKADCLFHEHVTETERLDCVALLSVSMMRG